MSSGGGTSIISFGFGSKNSKNSKNSRKRLSAEQSTKSSLSTTSELPSMPETKSTVGKKNNLAVRQDGLGYSPDHHASNVKISSLSYFGDESQAFKAYAASEHYSYRGTFWNKAKRQIMVRYAQLAMIGLCQGSVAYWCNYACHFFTEVSLSFRLNGSSIFLI